MLSPDRCAQLASNMSLHQADLYGMIHHVGDLLGVPVAQRALSSGGYLADNADRPALNLPAPSHQSFVCSQVCRSAAALDRNSSSALRNQQLRRQQEGQNSHQQESLTGLQCPLTLQKASMVQSCHHLAAL